MATAIRPLAPAGRPEARARPAAPSPWLLMLPLGIALAMLPPVLSGTLVLASAGATVLLARPRWALYLLALTVPYQSLVDVRIYDVSVSITEGVVAALVAGWVNHLMRGRVRRPTAGPLVAVIAALLVTFSLSALVATNLALSAKEMLKWVELAAVFVIAGTLLETPAQRRTLLAWVLVAGVSQAAVGLAQSVLRIGPGHFMIGGLIMRAYGTFEQPNPFGGFMGLTLPVAVSLALFGGARPRWRRAAVTSAALVGAALLITLSRGAWIAQLAALAVVVLVGSRRARQVFVTGALFSVVLLAVFWPLAPSEITGRASSVAVSALDLGSVRTAAVTPENWAVMERLSQWHAGWEMFRQNPILGVGIGNYNAAYSEYRLDQWPVALGHAHNHYLTVAAEAGLLGLVLYLAFWLVVFRAGAAAVRRAPDQMGRATAVGILGALTSFTTHNLFDVLFVHGMGVTVALLLSLLHAVPQGLKDSS